MALRDNTVGEILNAALRTIGEPGVTELTSENELQNLLIDQLNETVHDLLEGGRYRWGLNYDYFQTKAALTTGTVAVTNGSTTVTSKDSDGASADNFTNVAAGDFLRVTADNDSYEVSSTSTGSSPDTLTLSDEYRGSTSTGTGYTILKDIYALTISSLDEIVIASYGEKGKIGLSGTDELSVASMAEITRRCAGNRHQDASGKPRYMAQISPDSSGNPRFVLWPYPDSVYPVELWYTPKFTSDTAFSTKILGDDAPDIAYDAVRHKLRWRACVYDNDPMQAAAWQQEYQNSRYQLVARESRQERDENQMSLETYRRHNYWRRRSLGQSQSVFDRY